MLKSCIFGKIMEKYCETWVQKNSKGSFQIWDGCKGQWGTMFEPDGFSERILRFSVGKSIFCLFSKTALKDPSNFLHECWQQYGSLFEPDGLSEKILDPEIWRIKCQKFCFMAFSVIVERNGEHSLHQMIFLEERLISDYSWLIAKKWYFFAFLSKTAFIVEDIRAHSLSTVAFPNNSQSQIIGDYVSKMVFFAFS